MRKIGQLQKHIALLLIPFFILSMIPDLFMARDARAEMACWNDGRKEKTEGGNKDNLDDNGDCNQDGQEKGLDDVNFYNGNFNIGQRDFLIPTRGLPIEIIRTFNSQDPIDGPFGFGWNYNFTPFYVWHNDDSNPSSKTNHPALTKRNPDGSKDRFYTKDGINHTASRTCYDRLTREDSTFIMVEKHGTVWEINAASGHAA